MKPVIALVGRPNVGKSTLFNRLTKTRDAIVADFAGLTRDRHYGNGNLGTHDYIVIDTGGFEPDAQTGIYKEMAKQTRQAVAEADVVVFVVDARAGVSAQDYDIGKYLRKLGKPCILTANKAEGMTDGAFVRPVLLRHCLVDPGHQRSALPIDVRDVAPFHDLDAEVCQHNQMNARIALGWLDMQQSHLPRFLDIVVGRRPMLAQHQSGGIGFAQNSPSLQMLECGE